MEENLMCTTMNELEKVVADYRSLKAMKEELDAQLKDAEREMISYLDSNNKLTESGKDFTIKVSTCERRTLDSKQLEADLGSLADYQRVRQSLSDYVRYQFNPFRWEVKPKKEDNMKIVKVTSKEELEKLEKIVNEKLELVKTVRDSFGWDCFTEEPEQKIKVLRKLNELLIFSAEPDDLNEQLVELEAEDSKTYSMICRFIKAQLSK